MSKSNKNNFLISIAGFDPSGCAGTLADVRVFQHYKIPYQAVLTAVTAQSKTRFLNWEPTSLQLFKQQLQSLSGKIKGVKLGMLATLSHVEILLQWLNRVRPSWVVWDPVLYASAGVRLLRVKRFDPLLKKLVQRTHVWTPNVPEAEWFLETKITSLDEMKAAVVRLYRLGKLKNRVVILKGGHLISKKQTKAIDLFYDGKQITQISTQGRLATARGTGCAFASALLAGLYQGKPCILSTRQAKRYVLKNLF